MRPAATGPSTPATATTAASSSRPAPGRSNGGTAVRAAAAPGDPRAADRHRDQGARPLRRHVPRVAGLPRQARPAVNPRLTKGASSTSGGLKAPFVDRAGVGAIGPHDRPECENAPVSLLGPAEVRRLAEELGIRPTKKLGQNFVHDPNTVRKIVAAAELTADDVVLEVGPGLGSLTLALLPARQAGRGGGDRPAAGSPAASDGRARWIRRTRPSSTWSSRTP